MLCPAADNRGKKTDDRKKRTAGRRREAGRLEVEKWRSWEAGKLGG